MGLLRAILIAIAVWIFWAIVRKLLFVRMAQDRDSSKRKLPSEKMVACAVCETFVPISEAISARGKLYCSRKHEREDQ
jgi:hypothetical protein